MKLRQDQAPPHCTKAEQGIPPQGMGSKEPAHASGTGPGPTARGPTKDQATQLSPRYRGPRSVLCGLLAVCPESVSSHKFRSALSVGFPVMILTPPLAHIISPPSLHLDSRSSAQCMAVGPCIYFHQVRDKGSIVTIRAITKLITGESQLKDLLQYC